MRVEYPEDPEAAAEAFIRETAPERVEFFDRETGELEGPGDEDEGGHAVVEYEDGYEHLDDDEDEEAWRAADDGPLPEDERTFYEYVIMDLHEGTSDLIEEQKKFLREIDIRRGDNEARHECRSLEALWLGMILGVLFSRAFS